MQLIQQLKSTILQRFFFSFSKINNLPYAARQTPSARDQRYSDRHESDAYYRVTGPEALERKGLSLL